MRIVFMMLLMVFSIMFGSQVYAKPYNLSKILKNECTYEFIKGLLCDSKPLGPYSEICVVNRIEKDRTSLNFPKDVNTYLGLSISFRDLPKKMCAVKKTGWPAADIANGAIARVNTEFSAIADYHLSTLTIGDGKIKLQRMQSDNEAEKSEEKNILDQVVKILRGEQQSTIIAVLPDTKPYIDNLKNQSLHKIDLKDDVGEYESGHGLKSWLYKVSKQPYGECLVVFEKLKSGLFINIFPMLSYQAK